MSFFESLKHMDKKFSFSFLGFILALIFGFVTLYLGFIKPNRPDLNIIIQDELNAFEINEELKSLEIIYNGDSLSKNELNLKIVTLRIINQGDMSILSNYYDSLSPLGVIVENGSIVDYPLLVGSSNKYLYDNARTIYLDKNKITIPKLIFEPNDYIELKIYIIHKTDTNIKIKSLGKVAGVKEIDVIYEDYENDNSILQTAFNGGLLPNLIRFISYGILGILLAILILIISIHISENVDVRKKKKLVKKFKKDNYTRITELDNVFFNFYLENYAARMFDHLDDLMNNRIECPNPDDNTFKLLINNKIIIEDNGKVSVCNDRYKIYTEFMKEVNESYL